MQENREHNADNPLRNLTEAQFMALGGNAVVYVKHVKGTDMGPILPGAEFDESSDFHIVVSADGSAADGRRQRRRGGGLAGRQVVRHRHAALISADGGPQAASSA